MFILQPFHQMEDGWWVEGWTGRSEFGRFVIWSFNFLPTSMFLSKIPSTPLSVHPLTHNSTTNCFPCLCHYSRSCTIRRIYSTNTMYYLRTDYINGREPIDPSLYSPTCSKVCILEWMLPWDILVTSRSSSDLLRGVSRWFGRKVVRG